jgi:hypothetical protein
MVAELVVYTPVNNCIAPTGMIAIIVIPPAQCPAPINMQSGISMP